MEKSEAKIGQLVRFIKPSVDDRTYVISEFLARDSDVPVIVAMDEDKVVMSGSTWPMIADLADLEPSDVPT